MGQDGTVTLICSFIGGFGMGWLRGFKWFGEAATYTLALLGGAAATWLTANPTDAKMWALGIMAHTLTVLGAVHAAGGIANAREATNLPVAIMPKFSEFGNKEGK